MQFGLDTNAATEAHSSSDNDGSSDILNVSDLPPVLETDAKKIIWERKSGDRKRQLHGEGIANTHYHYLMLRKCR